MRTKSKPRIGIGTERDRCKWTKANRICPIAALEHSLSYSLVSNWEHLDFKPCMLVQCELAPAHQRCRRFDINAHGQRLHLSAKTCKA
ncbi:hypothetical protein EVAR_22072_1 [Eumeta japonica]|uniref:Uncharacterized protein n=1 Tax=Eumeta variegata TaxID=151549 RepID=A0A4C1UTA5_EUMVA|nr:hypothetical protein EVAR_22072_1 [Eumeta japonica]